MPSAQKRSAKDKDQLLKTLSERFAQNKHRHPKTSWDKVLSTLEKNEAALWSLQQMEASGGEPDVVEIGEKAGSFSFADCSAESPKGRRSICYDKKALDSRKENKPGGSAQEMAAAMGVILLNESQYRRLQELEAFDQKTSSWIETPESIRKLGGALFCDRRYNTVFVYHNGAESYYAARGFRAILIIS